MSLLQDLQVVEDLHLEEGDNVEGVGGPSGRDLRAIMQDTGKEKEEKEGQSKFMTWAKPEGTKATQGK